MKKNLYSLIFLLLVGALLSACSLPSATQTQQAQPVNDPNAAIPQSVATASVVTTSSLPAGMPAVETDLSKILSVLQSGNFSYLANLASEKYDASAYTVPGSLVFNAAFPSSQTIYLNYGWCAKDLATLQQNLQHISTYFSFNGQQIPMEYVNTISTESSDGLQCSNTGLLLSGWAPGTYQFQVKASFDSQINDGSADYPAGDYISEYTVTVQ